MLVEMHLLNSSQKLHRVSLTIDKAIKYNSYMYSRHLVLHFYCKLEHLRDDFPFVVSFQMSQKEKERHCQQADSTPQTDPQSWTFNYTEKECLWLKSLVLFISIHPARIIVILYI